MGSVTEAGAARVRSAGLSDRAYWHRYAPWFGQALVDEVEQTVEETQLQSAGGTIHVDVHVPPQRQSAGTVVFAHGIAGYGRLLAPLAVGLKAHGFAVLCPDLAGYGFTLDRRGDWTWSQWVQNVLDTLAYARRRFGGPLFLAGASLGGPLAYHAACHAPDLAALACYCLFDYRDDRFLAEVATARRLAPLSRPLLRGAAALMPKLGVPSEWVVSYRAVADDPRFVALLRRDPCAGNRISLRAVDSVLRAAPPTEYERFATPTLVLQPTEDRMIPPRWSRRSFERLSCEKRFVAISGAGHWVLAPDHVESTTGAIAAWFKRHAGRSASGSVS